MGVKDRLRKMTAPVAELDREKLREYCSRFEDVTTIAELRPREEHTVVGEISSLRIVPRPDGVPWLEATVSDGTGHLTVMWTGRRRIAGVTAGKRLLVTGRGSPKGPGGRLLIYNPRYQLL
jgi:hypothetical protein